MTDAPVDVFVDAGIATLTLNRPDAGNTINLPLARALLEAAIRCDNDAEIRCVLLTARGKLFCGGGDVGSFAAAGEQVPAYLGELVGTLHMAVTRLMRMRKPLLTVVHGAAAGAGLSLAICGDIVLAGRSAKFQAAYGAVGLTPDGGLTWLLPRLVGMRRAQEMIIGNRLVLADEAERIGLVTRLVDDGALAEEAAAEARRLADAKTGAIGGARELLLASYEGSFEGQLERETRSIAAASGTQESREGVAAFLSRKR